MYGIEIQKTQVVISAMRDNRDIIIFLTVRLVSKRQDKRTTRIKQPYSFTGRKRDEKDNPK